MYKIVTSGKTKIATLNELSQNLKVQSEIYALSDREIYLGLISHKTLVLFSTEFADYALQNYAKKKIPEAEICIRLTRKWLEDQSSVSREELNAAAAYAADAAAAAAYAAYATAYAAYAAAANAAAANAAAANAAHAAAAAAYAAYAAADADAVYFHAANAHASYAAGEDEDKEYLRQGAFILDFLKCGKNLFLV